ncbi:MAG: hypothetical protein OXR68_02120 [Alphaproteobacteria bacterium]|nr:hypothetical protein [Alphaproteobacteria bacterium]MDD9919407.1 hypothetical protein [Alphaproteobacteria bacterium]
MLTLVQPSYGMASAPLSAAEPTAKILEKQLQAKHAAVVPTKSPMSTGGGEEAVAAVVDAAKDVPAAYGLVSSVTVQDAAGQYAATERLMAKNYESEQSSKPQKILDI